MDSNSEKTSESSIENSSDGFITDFSIDDSMPPQEEILGIADEVNKKIGYKETNYWLVSGAVLTLLLSLTALAYYVKKNYFLLKLQNNPELSNIK